jgi:hypothetical protein
MLLTGVPPYSTPHILANAEIQCDIFLFVKALYKKPVVFQPFVHVLGETLGGLFLKPPSIEPRSFVYALEPAIA